MLPPLPSHLYSLAHLFRQIGPRAQLSSSLARLDRGLARKKTKTSTAFIFIGKGSFSDQSKKDLGMDSFVDVPLPMDKLSLGALGEAGGSEAVNKNQSFVVLVSTGSFNPPTYMHLRMFELAKDALKAQGYSVIGGYMSPANDAYRKKDLLSATHRVQLCELACKSSSFVMVDPWEAKQYGYQRTLTVLSRIKSSLCKTGLASEESLKIMLLCGSDLLESFSIPGFWMLDQVRTICRDFGVVCIRREGRDIEKIISSNEILNENMSNIISVDEIVPNQISATRVR